MSRVFISYNTRDSALAKKLSEKLRARGHELTIDIDSLVPGQDWRTTLMSSLKEADGLVVLLTENSLHSPFVLSEIGAARAFIQTSKKMFLLPVVVGGIEIPPVIGDLLAVRWDTSDAAAIDVVIDQLDKAISRHVGVIAAREQESKDKQTKLESDATAYVEMAIEALRIRELNGRIATHFWSFLGFIALLGGTFFAFLGIQTASNIQTDSWPIYALILSKSIVVVALLVASAKYAFTFSKAYMSEAIRNADRIHAISFGKFYLRAFGSTAEAKDIKEVFQHWNIDTPTAFGALDADRFDPKLVELIVQLIAAAKIEGKKKE
jgi:hypothetical protein